HSNRSLVVVPVAPDGVGTVSNTGSRATGTRPASRYQPRAGIAASAQLPPPASWGWFPRRVTQGANIGQPIPRLVAAVAAAQSCRSRASAGKCVQVYDLA